MLEVLVQKTETIKKELGSLSKVIDDDIERRLGSGIRHRDAERLAREIEAGGPRRRAQARHRGGARGGPRAPGRPEGADRALPDAARGSRRWTGFEPEPFRDALSCALELLGAEPLAETADDGRPPRLDASRRSTAAPRPTRAGPRPSTPSARPRKHEQKLADWRREAPIRPVVFEDAGVLTEETVHLHLEQRVAQRLLARFRAQGFIHHDLSRACLAQAADSIPRVILLGRLSLYGRGAERLHEELVPVAARWVEPSQRKRPARRPTPARRRRRRSSFSTSARLATAAAAMPGDADPAQAPRHGGARHRGAAAAARAARRGAGERSPSRSSRERGEREAKDLREMLERQRERVREELAQARERVRAAHPRLRRRREAPARGRTCAPGAAASSSSTRDLETSRSASATSTRCGRTRVEPVGLVYLWPETN